MINSPPLHSNSNKRLRFSLPRTKNNNDDLLISSAPEKFEDINNNHYQEENNSIDCINTMKQEIGERVWMSFLTKHIPILNSNQVL